MDKINLSILQDRENINSRVFISTYRNKIVNYRLYDMINGKSYVGTSVDLYQRIYSIRNGHLGSLFKDRRHDFIHQMILSVGINNFELYIESCNFETEEEALINEQLLINKYDSFNNGYNLTPDGKGGNQGGIFVTDGKVNLRIKPQEFPEYLSKGFRRGSNRVVVTDPSTGKFYRKPKEEADKLVKELGWTIGSNLLSTTKGLISISNKETGETRKISKEEQAQYLDNGWELGFAPNKVKKVHMIDPAGKEVIVKIDSIENYKKLGYKIK